MAKSLQYISIYVKIYSHQKSHLVTSHFFNDFDVRKKVEVYNILIINI